MQPQRTLSNLQQELLTLYARNISEGDILAIKKLLTSYFAKKAEKAIESVWQEQGFTPEDTYDWAQEHNRSSQTV